MNRTHEIAGLLERLGEGCLGDAEFCVLQDRLLHLAPEASYSAGSEAPTDLEPPY